MVGIKTEIDNYNKYTKEIPLIDLDNAYLYYELMYVIDLVFSKFDIEYSLTFGSLLGALRHGGLIPWDADYVNDRCDEFKNLKVPCLFEPRDLKIL